MRWFSHVSAPAAALAFIAWLPQSSLADDLIYKDRTERTPVWSQRAVTETPSGDQVFRGPFQSQSVSVTLEKLPDHAWIKVRFNLLVIGSWDGSSRVWGPDLWSAQVRGGPRLFFTTFGNMGQFSNNDVQAYPDDFPWGKNPAWTGATSRNSLGFPTGNGGTTKSDLNDALYPVEAIFPHSAESLILDFSGNYDDPWSENQSWGISGFEVTVLNEPPAIDDATLPGLWDTLGSKDPVQANAAMWKLVCANDRAVNFIADKVTQIRNHLPRTTPPVTGLEAVRLHRAHRILGLLNTSAGNGLRFEIDHLIPEYFQDL